jgi:hypothetical protein
VDRGVDLVVVLVLLSASVGALALVLMRKATQAEQGRPEFSLVLLWFLIRHRPVWTANRVVLEALSGMTRRRRDQADGTVWDRTQSLLADRPDRRPT